MNRHNGHQADYGSRITRAEAGIAELRKGFDNMSSKLDTVIAAVARSGPQWTEMLSIIRDGAVLFALVVSGILYLSNNISSNDFHTLDKRMQSLEMRLTMGGK